VCKFRSLLAASLVFALALSPIARAQKQGPSTGSTPYLLRTQAGVETISVLTVDNTGDIPDDVVRISLRVCRMEWREYRTVRGTPDAFVFAILDKTLSNIPTTGLGDSLLLINLNSLSPSAQTFSGTGAFSGVTVAAIAIPNLQQAQWS
jgi:hypothetical protein